MTPKDKPLTKQELLDAGIQLYPEEIDSDIIYIDRNGNEFEPPVEGEPREMI